MSYDQDYGIYTGHRQDPRTPDEPERAVWEESVSFFEILEQETIDTVLMEVLYGDSAVAKKALDKALDVEFREHLKRQETYDAECRAEAKAEDKRWAA